MKAKTWICREVNLFLFVWYHAEGDAPSWEVSEAPEVSQGLWKNAGRMERTITAHYQDIVENLVDIAHLNHLHTASPLLSGEDYFNSGGKSWKGRWFQQSYEADWSTNGPESTLKLDIKSRFFGRAFPLFNVSGSFRVMGPAFLIAHGTFGKRRFCSAISMTPTGPLVVKVVHYLFTEPAFPWIVGKFLHLGVINMVSFKSLTLSSCLYKRL